MGVESEDDEIDEAEVVSETGFGSVIGAPLLPFTTSHQLILLGFQNPPTQPAGCRRRLQLLSCTQYPAQATNAGLLAQSRCPRHAPPRSRLPELALLRLQWWTTCPRCRRRSRTSWSACCASCTTTLAPSARVRRWVRAGVQGRSQGSVFRV